MLLRQIRLRRRACVAASLALPLIASAAEVPTFNAQVSRILNAHCLVCHGRGAATGVVPLVSYDEGRAQSVAIRSQVITRAMPPWPADPTQSEPMRNDARLSQSEIVTLLGWLDGGMPRGDPRDLPPTPAPTSGWQDPSGRPPDAVVSLPTFSVKASGEIPYIQTRVKVPFQNDRWISGLQVLPGNSLLVHHMGVTEVQLAKGVTPQNLGDLEQVAKQLGLPSGALAAADPAVRDPDDPAAYDMLATYTPGAGYESYGVGNAKRLKGGSNLYINFNIHYTTTGKPETDITRMGLWFQNEAPQHELLRTPSAGKTEIANGTQLLTDTPGTKAEGTDVAIPPIPPNADNYELIGITAYTHPVTLYTFQPHAHMRGKDFRYLVVYPDGRELKVLTVPRFDFHWQLTYELATPLHLPAGSKLVVIAHYDNSDHNAHLLETAAADPARKCGPEKQAYFRDQNQSWDEMFSPIVQYSNDKSASAKDGARAEIGAAVGCLAPIAGDGWLLKDARPLGGSASQSTSQTELSRQRNTSLGTKHYALIGARFFAPERYAGRKVAAKGALTREAGTDRLNLTSLQLLPGSCR